MRYFAKIEYLGTGFHGFQVQPTERTVQGTLCDALAEALGCKASVTGCSRTDAGVHANEFCLVIDSPGATVPADKLPVAIARFLPNDLSLFWAKECDKTFHPRYDVKEKEYLYRIMNQKVYDPFEYGRAWFLPRDIDDVRLKKMNLAATHFIGKMDFSAFMAEGSDVVDTVRNVTHLSVERQGNLIEIKIRADGFLYNMVRIIVGTLVDVAYGRFKPDDIPEIIKSGDRKKAGMTAPAEGLYLNRVFY
jgi:tRNA pseudouridine38-40 synthase